MLEIGKTYYRNDIGYYEHKAIVKAIFDGHVVYQESNASEDEFEIETIEIFERDHSESFHSVKIKILQKHIETQKGRIVAMQKEVDSYETELSEVMLKYQNEKLDYGVAK